MGLYNKTLQKFNPTKGRSHLTDHCPGVDDVLRQVLLVTTQAAKKSQGGSSDAGAAIVVGAVGSPAAAAAVASSKNRKIKSINRSSPAYISFNITGDDSCLNVTAPIENEVLVLRLSFPTDQLKLNYSVKNMEGAALCIDGFMNMHPDSSWMASLYSTTMEGTRGGPHCRWSMSADAFGVGGMTRAQKVEQLLKIMTMN